MIELNLSPLRVAALVALVFAYALAGGFAVPADAPVRMVRAWVVPVLLFVAGAALATVVDHRVGSLERTSLRWFHVVVGVGAMAVAVTMRHRSGLP